VPLDVLRADTSAGTDYGLDDKEFGFHSQQRDNIFLLSTESTPHLGLAQPPIRWVLGVLSSGGKAIEA
jgi:hypothetical protein